MLTHFFTKRHQKHLQKYLPHLDWQYKKEPTLLEWAQIGCPNDLKKIYKIYKIFFCFVTIFAAIFFLIGYGAASNVSKGISRYLIPTGVTSFFYFPIILIVFSYLKGSRIYCYRITSIGIEEVSWKGFYDQVKIGIEIFIGLIVVMCMFMFIIKPEAIFVSLGGIVGVGIIYGSIFYSEDFARTTRAELRHMRKWEKELDDNKRFRCIVLDREQQVIVIDHEDSQCTIKNLPRKREGIWLFCYKDNFDQVAELLKTYLPNLPQIEGPARIATL